MNPSIQMRKPRSERDSRLHLARGRGGMETQPQKPLILHSFSSCLAGHTSLAGYQISTGRTPLSLSLSLSLSHTHTHTHTHTRSLAFLSPSPASLANHFQAASNLRIRTGSPSFSSPPLPCQFPGWVTISQAAPRLLCMLQSHPGASVYPLLS